MFCLGTHRAPRVKTVSSAKRIFLDSLRPKKATKGTSKAMMSVNMFVDASATAKRSARKQRPSSEPSQACWIGWHIKTVVGKKATSCTRLKTMRALQARRTDFLVPPSLRRYNRAEILTRARRGV